MKTDNHFIYIGDCVNKLKWFKMRSFFIKKGDIICTVLQNTVCLHDFSSVICEITEEV